VRGVTRIRYQRILEGLVTHGDLSASGGSFLRIAA